jgi:hypothetical protein
MALVTAAQAATLLPGVSRQLICMWRKNGKLQPRGQKGRSPLYAWDDIITTEASTRQSGKSTRTLTC